MAFLFVDLTQNNNRYVQISFKILELVLLSAGLLSTLLMVKGALPPYSNCVIVFSSLIEFCTSITCFLSSPLSTCIIIHVMVVSIFASSAFFGRGNGHQHDEISVIIGDQFVPELADSLLSPPPTPRNIYEVPELINKEDDTMDARGRENGHQHDEISVIVGDHFVPELANSLSSPPPPTPQNIYEVPDLIKKKDDTMDATWKAITGEGKQRAKKKHLKKSETWDVHLHATPRGVQRLDSEVLHPTTPKWKELRKAETFNDAVSVTRRGGLIRRDPSMSIEEFNLQVEAFIKKFNDNMRLQRQESDQRFFENMNRGI